MLRQKATKDSVNQAFEASSTLSIEGMWRCVILFANLLFFVLSNLQYFILHVTNLSSFPRPLSAQKEREYLEKFKTEGDMKARDMLIEHNLRLVAHIVKKYYSGNQEQDDLISIGTIGLIKAVNTFDYTKGTRLATYAARCIENAIITVRKFRSCSSAKMAVLSTQTATFLFVIFVNGTGCAD